MEIGAWPVAASACTGGDQTAASATIGTIGTASPTSLLFCLDYFTGTMSMFAEHGFAEILRRNDTRPIVRLTLRS